MKSKTALLSGNGTLPRVIANALSEQGKNFEIICFDEENATFFEGRRYKVHAMSFENIVGILKKLREIGTTEIVFCGGVRFCGIRQMKLVSFDNLKLLFVTLKSVAKILISRQRGDDFLLSIAQKMLQEFNMKIVGVHEIVPELICGPSDEINANLAREHKGDIELGKEVLAAISKFDIGQSIVVQNGRIIGMEGAEGTDELIRRCGNYKQNSRRAPVLVKMCKVGQSTKTDLPTIGINTFKRLKESGFAGVAISCGSAIVLDREEIMEFCEREIVFLRVI